MVVAAIAVAAVAFFGIGHFERIADRNATVLELLADIRADTNLRNAREWQAIAEKRVGRANVELDEVTASLGERITRLARFGHQQDAAGIMGAYESYLSAVDLEFRYLASGHLAQAQRVNGEQVDPRLKRLGSLVAAATATARRNKASAARDETLGKWFIGVVALTIISGLLGAFVRLRQRAAVSVAQQESLEQQVTATQRLVAEREFDANHDSLTGLPNRRHFLNRLADEVARLGSGGAELAVMLIDLNGFKDVNDTLGHHAGDDVLTQVGVRLEAAVRGEDLLARLGGDEFALLVPAAQDLGVDGIHGLAARIHAALDVSFLVDGLPVALGASVGIAIGPHHGGEAEALLQHADVAMYLAKSAGIGTVVYTPGSDPHSRDQLRLASELRQAFANGEIVLHYQPKMNLGTGEVIGVEALARWQHPRRGMLSPAEFLPVVARTGTMRQLTSYVLERALAQAGRWKRDGLSLRVAVNLSVADLLDEGLPDEIAEMLARHDVDGKALQLEVTENVFMTAPERVAEVIAHLGRHGVTLSLDDFGAGYSSLAHLRRLDVDELKIDRSFVTNIATNAFDTAVVRSTVGLGHSLSLRVVAEGVETEATFDELRDYGCDEAQGFYIHPPAPADELTTWLHHRLETGCLGVSTRA